MAHNDKNLAFQLGRGQLAQESGVRQLVTECRKVVERALPKLMNTLFEKLDEALYELADKSDSEQLQTVYFDAMRALRRHRTGVQTTFLAGVLEDFDGFWARGPQAVAPQQQPATDSGSEELEESLAVCNLVSKGESRYHRELCVLNHRLSILADQGELDDVSNPVGPAALCNRFYQANRMLDVAIPVRLVIYKLFDKHVMNYVGGLYEEINSLLGHAGIATRPADRMRMRPGRTEADTPTSTAGGPAGQTDDGASPTDQGSAPFSAPERVGRAASGSCPSADVDSPMGRNSAYGSDPFTGKRCAGYAGRPPAPCSDPAGSPRPQVVGAPLVQQDPGAAERDFQGDMFPTLQKLLAGYRASQGRFRTEAGPDTPVVARRELLAVLSTLQKADSVSRPALPDAGPGQDLRQQVADRLRLGGEGEAARILDTTDEDTLDVIALLFEIILEDPNLPDFLKVMIGRLRIPILKVAIMDKDFFSHRLHPARRLLNGLARAVVGWTDQSDRSENGLYARMESITDRVVGEFEEAPALLEQLAKEFDAYLEREQRGVEIAEERTKQVTRGKERLRRAKERVAAEIACRLEHNRRLPRVVRELLDDAWEDVLLLVYLRQGPDSAAWQQGLALADRLVWSVQPKNGYEERQELLRTIPNLLRSLREGFNGISFDQHKTARLFKELESCHIACLRGAESRAPGNVPADQVSAPCESGPVAGEAQPEAAASTGRGGDEAVRHDRFTDMAEALDMGAWLELTEDEGRRIRVKLSWKSDVSDAFVFVNHKGVKVLEMTRAGVAKLLREGKASILREVNVPILDRALGNMIETLRNPQVVRN
jgi:hypothetical protein